MKKQLLLALFLLTFGWAHGQKVGLVLSGGGAKGFAHIGVIEILDSLGIPVDYVTGTSMGSVMGALYSIGYTGEEMRQVVNSQDWADLMGATPARKYRSYEWKIFKEKRLADFVIANGKIGLPSGVNSGQKIYTKLNEFTIGYHGDQNFNAFPRGFACVAVDLETGKEVVFHQGSLPDAVRASMSIPSYFDPHPYQGMYLVDGGVMNNMPTDVIKAMGADIIIGVDVAETARKLEPEDLTIVNVLVKSSMMGNQIKMEEHFAMCNVLIHPEIDSIGVLDFDDPNGIIELGKIKARSMIPQLLELKAQLNGRTKEVAPYTFRDSIQLTTIAYQGFEQESPEAFSGMTLLEPETKVTPHDLYESLNFLWGSQRVKTANINLTPQGDNRYAATLNIRENQTRHTIGVGVRYDSDFGAALLFNYTGKNLFRRSDLLSMTAVPGEAFRANIHYAFPLKDHFGLFMAARYWYNRPSFYLDRDFFGNLVEYDFQGSIGVTKSFSLNGMLSAGALYDYVVINTKDIPLLSAIGGEVRSENPMAAPFVRFYNDSYDHPDFPYRGNKIKAMAAYYVPLTNLPDANTAFAQISASYRQTHRLARKWAVQYEGAIGQSYRTGGGATVPFPYAFFTGGLGLNYYRNQTTMPGYRYREYLMETGDVPEGLAKLEVLVRFQPFKHHYISVFGAAAGVSGPNESVLPINDQSEWIAGYGARYSIDTFLGPLEASYHLSAIDGLGFFYLNLGHWF